jgi:hypothetical protein
MTSSGDLRPIAQAIIDGPWQHKARALDACRRGTWAAFVAATAPPRPALLGRWSHGACVRHAATMFAGPRRVAIDLIPVWAGGGEDEVPSTDWHVAHARCIDGGALCICETGPVDRDADPCLDLRVSCQARRWEVGHVVQTRHYSPEIPLALRRGELGVMAGEILEVIELEARPGTPLPRPISEVPPFCSWYEPRVAGLPDSLVSAIRRLSITVDEEGGLVPRPGVDP